MPYSPRMRALLLVALLTAACAAASPTGTVGDGGPDANTNVNGSGFPPCSAVAQPFCSGRDVNGVRFARNCACPIPSATPLCDTVSQRCLPDTP